MRILGKGKTALAVKEVYPDAILYDDKDINSYEINSDEITVVSPGIPPYNQLVTNSKNIISDYDLFYEQIPFSIWISGTNGKTTTTQMLQHLLENRQSQCGGNIGVPIAKMDTNKKIWILETSSFTLHYTKKAKPNIYILLPISEDHLSWHGSFEEYKSAKLKPLSVMTDEDIAILPSSCKGYKTKAKTIYYTSTEDLEKKFEVNSKEINFKEPFLLDAILALCVTKIVTNEIDYKKINSFVQDPHKLEEFRDNKNHIWIDDSKATNVDATLHALHTYKEKLIYLILGGDDKGVDLNHLFRTLQNYEVELFAIGKNCDKLMLLANTYNLKANRCQYLNVAVKEISMKLNSCPEAVVLLSPAAASLDQFSSYKQRGEKFKEFVNSLRY
ncbi:UDP-N-acetylmuramoyl-L-alanine--D-glutamate ligase [Arcobacter sp. 15-2]|uniref:UDP-N-acetylmuramoyl-L-alanine--D-glutamate ligase n=1 Tax=Arcobacter sp. 15-2 TaxID=3374109 RepID=UPI00399C7F5A